MTRNSRLQQWYDSLTNYTREDVKSVAGVLLMHKFLFGIGMMSAYILQLHNLASKSGWSAQSVVSASYLLEKTVVITGLAGMAALPWIVVWRYWIYPRAKQYRLGDFLSHLVVVSVGLAVMLLLLDALQSSPGETAETVKETASSSKSLVDSLRPFVGAGILVISAATLTTLWERYLDGRLVLHTRRRRVAAVLGVTLLLLTPGIVGAVPATMLGADDGGSDTEAMIRDEPDLTNRSVYSDGIHGPDIDEREAFVPTDTPAEVVVEDEPATVKTPPDLWTPDYAVASVSYNASIVQVNETRVTAGSVPFTPPNHYTFDALGDDRYVLSSGAYHIDRVGGVKNSAFMTYGTTLVRPDGHLTMEGVDSAWYFTDVVGPEGKVHRYIVKLDNPVVNDEESTSSEPNAAANITSVTDGNASNTVTIKINSMPPKNQYQAYGLWEGCSVDHEFNTTGTYTVVVEEDTNVKLVRLGDYRVYGYHDFAPAQPDKCPPS